MVRAPRRAEPHGLSALRRPGAVTELLFLYECATQEIRRLKPIADRLGLTVQAASHIFRALSREGFAEVRGGLYRPTVAGVAWLHGALGALREDIDERHGRLNVVRSTRAVAEEDLPKGCSVTLEMKGGRLTAGRGAGASHGETLAAARKGALVEVGNLEGIVPVPSGEIHVLTFRDRELSSPSLVRALERTVGSLGKGVWAAFGLEAEHLLASTLDRPFLRFGVAAACLEASRVGVDSTIVVRDLDLPRLLGQFSGPSPPPLTVRSLLSGDRRDGGR